MLAGARKQLINGGLEPLRWQELSEPQQQRVLDALTADRNESATLILAPLFLEGGAEPLRNQLKEVTRQPYAGLTLWDPSGVRKLSLDDQLYLLDLDITTDVLMMRRELLLDKEFTPEIFTRKAFAPNTPDRFLTSRARDEGIAVRTMCECATRKSPETLEAVRKLLAELVAAGRIGAAGVTAATLSTNEMVLDPGQLEPVSAAFSTLLRQPNSEEALTKFKAQFEALKAAHGVEAEAVVAELLSKAHTQELKQGISLRDDVEPEAQQDQPGVADHSEPREVGEVPPQSATLSSFDRQFEFEQAYPSQLEAAALLPRLAFELRLLKLRLERKLVMSFIETGSFSKVEDFEAEAEAIANRISGAAFEGLSPAQKYRLFSAGRVLIDNVVSAIESLNSSLDDRIGPRW